MSAESRVQLEAMKSRSRRLTRREKWPLHVGLFLLYIVIQMITSVYTSNTEAPLKDPLESSELQPPIQGQEEVTNERKKMLPNISKELNHAHSIAKGIGGFIDKAISNKKQALQESKQKNEETDNKSTAKEEKMTKVDSMPKVGGSKDSPKAKNENKTTVNESKEANTTSLPETTTPTIGGHITVKPTRDGCFPPAIEQFPKPLMSAEGRKHGGLIIHILVAIYTFFGLAIVCDDYFVSSLDRICEELRLSPDVAGATFMAAGSSAPELATVIIGVFFAKDDIGVSGVIGSAAFNIMFVISICGLCSGTVSKLNWWPLCRDCFFYAVSILVMLGTIYNDHISWMEALFMLIMYVVYCVALYFNAPLERWAKSLNLPYLPKDDEPAEESALVSYRSLQEERLSYTGPNSPVTDQLKSQNQEGNGMQEYNDPDCPKPAAPRPAQPEYYKAKGADPNEVSPLVKPTDGGKWKTFSWGLVYPIHFMARATMPDCRQEKWKRWYPFTFCVSMIWISFYSYFMVWMITIIGSTLGIPDTVMGLTFVAAGVSVPDALSSLAVIKEGQGDMAVSNAVGSNVFDILVCLGLPWFIQTAMVKPGSLVNVTSKGLTYSTLSLLSTVAFLVVATHLNGWKLDRRYGVILMIWYLIFITFASLYELNIFGPMNPISCPTKY